MSAPRILALAVTLPLAASLAVATTAKPCTPPVGVSAEDLLARAAIARKLAGTESVALDASRSCIDIAVRTTGTARLLELVLRGMAVPTEAVRFQLDSSAVPAAARRT